jgi:hypothetical protein
MGVLRGQRMVAWSSVVCGGGEVEGGSGANRMLELRDWY